MIEEGIGSIVDHALDIICTIDESGRFTWMNKASLRILGYNPEEIVGREFITLVYEEDRQNTLRVADEIVQGIEVTNFENRYVRRDGSLVPIVWSATWDSKSKIMHCIARDATEKKKAEDQLRRSEQRFRALVQEGGDLIGILNPDATYKYVSPTSSRILGFDPEYFIGKNAFDFIHPTDQESVMASFLKMETEKTVHITPFRFQHSNGSWRWIETVVTNLTDDPSIEGIVANSRDVTERLEADQRLKESEKRYRQLFENNPAPMLILDMTSLAITDCNESALSLYGYTKAEFVQLTIGDMLVSREEMVAWEGQYENLRKKQCRHKKKTGEVITLEVSGYAMESEGRSVLLLMMHDITEKEAVWKRLKDNQAKLANAQKIAMLGYWEFDLNTRTFYWTSEAYTIWGREQDKFELTPEILLETVHPDDRALFLETQRKALKGNTEQSIDIRVMLPDTTAKWIRIIGKGHVKKEERYQFLAGTVQDITQQKNLSLSLELVNQRYIYATMATSQAIWDWDLVSNSVYWGEGFHQLTGFEASETGPDFSFWLTHVHPDDLDRLSRSIEEVIAGTGSIWMGEYRFLKKDGHYAFVLDKGFVIRDGRGKGIRMVGAMQDITQQKHEELQKLLNAEISRIFNQAQGFGETMGEVLKAIVLSGNYLSAEAWLADPQGKYMHLMEYCGRDAAGSPTGRTAVFQKCAFGQGLPGEVWEKGTLVHWTSLEYAQKSTHRRSFLSGESAGFSGVPLLYNGQVLGALIIEGYVGSPNESTSVASQIGNHLGGEIMRKKLEQELYQIVNHAQHIICVLDLEGTFRKVNPAACTILEYDEEELLNRAFIQFIHPDDTWQISQNLQNAKDHEPGFHFESRSITKSGKVRWLNWTMTIPPGERSIFAIAKDITDQKNLKDLLARVNSLARIGGWEYDMIKQSVFWSPITREIFEVGPDYRPDRESMLQFYADGMSRMYVEQMLEGSNKPNEKWDTELLVITERGNERWVRLIGEAEVIGGICTRVFGSFQDIHASKSTELRLKSVSNNIPGVIFQYHLLPDGTDRLQFVSEGVREIWFLTPEECTRDIGLVWAQIFAGGDSDIVKQSIKESARTLSRWHCQWKVLNPDGSLRWQEGFGSPRLMSDGTVVWDSIVMDITEKKQLENLLDSSSQMARIGSWEYNVHQDEYNTMYWSPMVREILEIGPELTINEKTAYGFVHPDSHGLIRAATEKLTTSGEPFDLELILITASGKEQWVRCIGKIEYSSNVSFRMYGSCQDIHQRKLAEIRLQALNEELVRHARELALSNAELEQFAYVASHDLQEPLRMITSFLTQLEKKYDGALDDKARRYIHFAVDGATRMRQIILDLLDFSRVGKHEDELKTVELSEVVDEVCHLQWKLIRETKAKIHYPDLPAIRSYHSPLLQVFQNLVSNALKYRKPGVAPEILIRAESRAGSWLLSVADNGIGIESEYFGKIFVIFQRLHTREEYGGTGMGLAIVKKIVENLGGEIWIESIVGEGSTFYLEIPKI